MKKIVLLFIVFSLQQAFCQEYKIVNHNVQMGETVRMISKKYRVAPSEIYKLNKFAVDGITNGMVLQIPVEQKETQVSNAAAEVVPEENPVAENTESAATVSENPPEEITHTVSKGETLFSLARMYHVSVDELKKQNEKSLQKGLQSGQVLTIRTTK